MMSLYATYIVTSCSKEQIESRQRLMFALKLER